MNRYARAVAELLVLFALYALGTWLAQALGWPIPGGVVGLALLLLVFALNGLKPAHLQLGAGLLMAEMLLFFIPALMSLLDYGALVRQQGLRILLVIAISTVVVMLVTAFTVDAVFRWRMRRDT
nr:CidA/LrgA family protein [Pseudomonas typographi]